jgi:hypothetical protein
MIVVQGGTGAQMYLVIEGRAFSEKNGYEKLIEYGPGQLFGELSALIAAASQPTQGSSSSSSHSTPMRQATVTAHTDMMVMVLDAADITNRRNEAMAAGNKRVVECCGYALAAIESILEIEGDVQKVTLETYRAAEKVAQTKKKAKADGGSSIGGGGGGESPRGGSAAGSKTDEHGLWTTVANCWSGCIDYIGPKDPDYAYEDDDDDAEEAARNETDAADAEVAELTNRAHSRPANARHNTKRGGGGGGGGAAGNTPLSAEARSRPMVLAGLGPDATHGAKNVFFGVVSLCLSRACLGKMIVFIYKWLKKAVFCRLGGWIRRVGIDKACLAAGIHCEAALRLHPVAAAGVDRGPGSAARGGGGGAGGARAERSGEAGHIRRLVGARPRQHGLAALLQAAERCGARLWLRAHPPGAARAALSDTLWRGGGGQL